MNSLRKFAGGVVVVLVLLFLTEAVRYLLLNPRGEGSTVLADDPFRRPFHLLIYVLLAVALLTRPRVALAAIRRSWAFWLLTVLAVASTSWSISPTASLRAGVGIAATGLLGMCFDLRFSVREQLRLLGIAVTAVIAASLAFALLPPYLGLEQTIHEGAWRGAYPQKNAFGRAMALAVLTYGLLLTEAGTMAPLVLSALVAAALLAVLSQSATALVVIVALSLLVPLGFAVRSKRFSFRFALVVSTLGAGIIIAMIYAYSEVILEALGRDASLSGRPLLWASLLPEILTRPYLGFGVAAFWGGGTGASAVVESIVGWKPVHAHNGFIDVVLDTGLLGLSLLVVGFLIAGRLALLQLRQRSSVLEAAWPAAFLVFFLLTNMSESSILRPYTIFWFLYASVFTRLTRTEAT